MVSPREAMDYVRAHGLGAAARKAVRVYLHDRRRNYLGRVDHAAGAAAAPVPQHGLTFRFAHPDDVPGLVTSFAEGPASFARRLRPPSVMLLALEGERPVAYQCLSPFAPPTVRPVLPLAPDQIFSGDVLVHPALRGRGVIGQLMTAASHLLLARGIRERWFTIDGLNHVSEDAFFRGAHATDRVGTLTRTCRLGRVRFEFVPATPLSARRIARLLSLLTAVRGPVSRVAMLLDPASLTVDPRRADEVARAMAPPGVELRPVVVRSPPDPAPALSRALDAIGAARPDALVVLWDPLLAEHRRVIVTRAMRWRLPAVYEGAPFAAAGGLVACRPPAARLDGLPAPLRRLGQAAGDGPEAVVNAAAARVLGLTIPPALPSGGEEEVEQVDRPPLR